MGRFHLVEPCAGSAALTLHLLGAKRQVVPYQGSKWKLRKKLEQILSHRGFTELGGVTLNDIGPWGPTWFMLTRQLDWVIDALKKLEKQDPRTVYNLLQGLTTPSTGDPYFAASFLFLQRLSHSGKAVGLRGVEGESYWLWNSPGFNGTSAYGTPKTDKFGAVNPMIPSLIRVLESMRELEWPDQVHCTWVDAAKVNAPTALPRVVYLDPNYQGSTGYPNGGLSRAEVVATALHWHDLGATVMISEGQPLTELFKHGWTASCLKGAPGDDKPFQSKGEEWLTMSPVDDKVATQ